MRQIAGLQRHLEATNECRYAIISFSIVRHNHQVIIQFAKEQERVAAAIGDKKIVKEIYVPGKLVNLVAK